MFSQPEITSAWCCPGINQWLQSAASATEQREVKVCGRDKEFTDYKRGIN